MTGPGGRSENNDGPGGRSENNDGPGGRSENNALGCTPEGRVDL